MRRVKRLLPVIFVTGIIILISFLLYVKIMDYEKEECWQSLHEAAQSANKEITMKFQDEVVKLHLLKNLMLQDGNLQKEEIDYLHIDSVQPTTIFSRIDIIYPDNTVILNGNKKVSYDDVLFDDVLERGEHISSRKTDIETGEECVYYIIPVEENGEVLAILIGVINASDLPQIFRLTIYDGNAFCCIIDSVTGDFIMDNWHKKFENAYEILSVGRKRLKGYEDVDIIGLTKNLETGVVAFESQSTGDNLYTYCTPLGVFDWELTLFVRESVVFENLIYFKRLLLYAGLIEALLLVLYFMWNIETVGQLEKSNTEIQKQKEELKYISYRDMLTAMYNRNRYIEVLNSFGTDRLKNMGIVYLDLNGLKQINDTQSHKAGDTYICNAANVMLDIFPENSYRIGGDEFVILEFDVEHETFLNRVKLLTETMQKESISISIGSLWEELCENLEELIKQAEAKMYADKDDYYLTHERKR